MGRRRGGSIVIGRRTVLSLGLSQLIAWGVTYYMIGGFGPLIAADLGWSTAVVQGGFSLALLMMGVVSSPVGRLIDRHGGRPVMAAGSVLAALGCLALAGARGPVLYFAAWACLGVAMRCALYDAAFAALARIGGVEAKRAISQITLLGGLASTTFWPLGNLLAAHLGWRGALVCYAGFALLTLPLHLAIPATRFAAPAALPGAPPPRAPLARTRREKRLAGALYALVVALTNVLNSGTSAHMIGLLTGLGLAATPAVWVAALRGLGQSGARLGEVMFGRGITALDLNLLATVGLPLSFLAGIGGGASLATAAAFSALYGAANGLLTITRGTLPLALFDPAVFGTLVGGLIAPSLFLSAAAPVALGLVIERWGDAAALALCAALGAVTLAAALALRLSFAARDAG